MNRTLLSGLLLTAFTLLFIAPAQQASAYDDYYSCRAYEPHCRYGDYHYRPDVYIPAYRCGYPEGCSLRRDRVYTPGYHRFPVRSRFVPGNEYVAPQGTEFRTPEFKQPLPQNDPRNNQQDPFDKFAPRKSQPGNFGSPSKPQRLDIPPPLPENPKKDVPATESNEETQNSSPFMLPTFPRLSPPNARLSIPLNS